MGALATNLIPVASPTLKVFWDDASWHKAAVFSFPLNFVGEGWSQMACGMINATGELEGSTISTISILSETWIGFSDFEWPWCERRIMIAQSDLPHGEPYEIHQAFVGIARRVDGDWLAEVADGFFAASGPTFGAAFTNLVLDILDAFDYLTDRESVLGPEPTRQLAYLKEHIARCQG